MLIYDNLIQINYIKNYNILNLIYLTKLLFNEGIRIADIKYQSLIVYIPTKENYKRLVLSLCLLQLLL